MRRSLAVCLSWPTIASLTNCNTAPVLTLHGKQPSSAIRKEPCFVQVCGPEAADTYSSLIGLLILHIVFFSDSPQMVHFQQELQRVCGPTTKLLMRTTAPTSRALKCRLDQGNCPQPVPPDSARSSMTSAPSAAVAKHVQLPQYSISARAARQVLQIQHASDLPDCRNATSLRAPPSC